MAQYILLTIDVEDWFQVENFKQYIPFSSWPSRELRVEKNTHRILDLLDSHSVQGSGFRVQGTTGKFRNSRKSCLEKPKATFFVLGWLAERLPNLVREIHARGHEVASHGYYHNLCSKCSFEALREDLTKSKAMLEDMLGAPVFGYRAPSFSINHEILQIIRDCGYLYDSSYNSFAMHGRYGHVDLSRNGQRGIAIRIPQIATPEPRLLIQQSKIANRKSQILYELPISNLTFSLLASRFSLQNFVLPWGGGGYFRLTPFPLFKLGVQSILKKQNAYLFYCHPWEIDPDQPRVYNASQSYKFRHYVNLNRMHSKLMKLITSLSNCSFLPCHQYLELCEPCGL